MEFTWRDWPATRRPIPALFAAAVILGASLLCASQDPLLGAIALVLLTLNTSEALLPTTWRLTADALEKRHIGANRYSRLSEFDTWEASSEGFTLRGERRSGRFRRLRQDAVELRLPEELRGQVAELLERALGPENGNAIAPGADQ